MSVADNSNPADIPPVKLKRIQRPITADDWRLARIAFETSDKLTTLSAIARQFNTSVSSVQKRSAAEQWSKGQLIVQSVKRAASQALQSSAEQAAREAGALAGRQIAADLAPWIEREKRAHIKRALKRAKSGLKRITKRSKGYQVYDAKAQQLIDIETNPKDEMHLATAEDKYDGIIRRNLGMNETPVGSGSLSLRILTEGAAIEVTQSGP